MAGFKEIIGHKREIAHLTKAMEAGKVSHAYIFSGAKFGYDIRVVNATAEFTQEQTEVQSILLNSVYSAS